MSVNLIPQLHHLFSDDAVRVCPGVLEELGLLANKELGNGDHVRAYGNTQSAIARDPY